MDRVGRRKFLRDAGLGIAGLAGLAGTTGLLTSLTRSGASAAGLEDLIDPEIQGEERDVMLGILAKLRPEHRQNIVYLDSSCRLFTNRVALRRDSEFLRPAGGSVYTTSAGEEVILPAGESDPNYDQPDPNAILICEKSNGPYRRLRSKKGTSSRPYAVLIAYVWLPSFARGEVRLGDGETAYIFSGGNPAIGTAMDAGLQYSKRYDNWSLFTTPGTCYPLISKRFASGQRVEFQCYVADDGLLTLAVYGRLTDGSYDWNGCVVSATGWHKDGIGNRFKRITSIAQKPVNFQSGAFIRGVEWSGVTLGPYSDTGHLPWTAADTGMNCVSPDTAKVYVDFRAFDHEIVSIDLR